MLTRLSADTGFPPLPGTVSRLPSVAGLSGCLPVCSRTLPAGSFPKASARERRLFVLATGLATTGHLRPGLFVLLEVHWSAPEPVLVTRQGPDARVEEREPLESPSTGSRLRPLELQAPPPCRPPPKPPTAPPGCWEVRL